MKRYILIQRDEDGMPFNWVKEEEVKDIVRLMEDYGITNFISEFPIQDGRPERNPNYWNRGTAMLLEVQIKRIVPTKIIESYRIEEDEQTR